MASEEIQTVVINWWENLQLNNGGKAQLKRCNSPEAAVLHVETHRLRRMLPSWVPLELVGTIAGVLANVKNKSSMGFIESLATPKERNGRVPFSESRFRQMLTCRDWTELYRNLRRAVTLLDGSVNLQDFIDTIFLWSDEFNDRYKRPGDGLKFKLSQVYYETAMKYEK